ncbi:MAG TPA: dihydroorotate dehydrogenase electron transfer subunit [Clostridia bacterium]|nr:dihydroorotate dehydrogenase electron transfer subunit [Clostridia bacterium]
MHAKTCRKGNINRVMRDEAAIGLGIVKAREEPAPGYVRLRLAFRAVAERARPGQFVHVYPVPLGLSAASRDAPVPQRRLDPFLRRPFSIHDADRSRGEFAILFKIIGKGTRELAEVRVGDALDVIGPLGNGFSAPVGYDRIILMGGGIGVAPLVLAAKDFAGSHRVVTLVGGRTAHDVLCVDDFEAAGAQVHVATEDGSLGFAGQVTDLFESLLSQGLRGVILACGPMPMMQKVADISQVAGLPAFFSLEDRFGCGLGACLGCAVRVVEPDGSRRYMRVCKEGPVVEAQKVDFDGT